MSDLTLTFDFDTQLATLAGDRQGTVPFAHEAENLYWNRISWIETVSIVCAAEGRDPSEASDGSWWLADLEDVERDVDDDGPWGKLVLQRVDEDPYQEGFRLRSYILDSDEPEWADLDVAEDDVLHRYKASIETDFVPTGSGLTDNLLSSDPREEQHRWFRTGPWVVRFDTRGNDKWRMFAKAPAEYRRLPISKVSFT